MIEPFACRASRDGRRLTFTLDGCPLAHFDFALPDAGDLCANLDDQEYRVAQGPCEVSLRHDDEDGWRTVVTVDNVGTESVALLPVGVGVTAEPGWAGWTWASDLEGIVVVAPLAQDTPSLVVRITGFVRVASAVPVFAPQDRRPDPMLPEAYAALHLVSPTGSLRAGSRVRTTLSFLRADEPGEAGQFLPAWLPDLVRDGLDEIVFDTPDQAVVGGVGVTVATVGNVALVTAAPGHREIAFHDARGVRRLRASFAPDLAGAWLGELAAELMRTRPSATSSAAATVVAGALVRGLEQDRDQTLDWLERVDWAERGDLLALGVGAALAAWNHDRHLAVDVLAAAGVLPPGPGRGLVLRRCGRAAARVGAEGIEPSDVLAQLRPG
ncbi:MAG: hypothetical protein ACK5LS_13185, partial [Propioniciclava sp.]